MEELHKIEAYTLVARGEFEPLITEDMIRDTASRIKRARTATIKGVGHYAPTEDPQGFANTVMSFLDEVLKK